MLLCDLLLLLVWGRRLVRPHSRRSPMPAQATAEKSL
jgi:hypothetical protein